MNIQQYKVQQLKKLPDTAGVYALCNLDEYPIYVGQAASSKDTSIRKRVQRHLTSARSDIIANRQIDVWEIAYVWAWVEPRKNHRDNLERYLICDFINKQYPLVNGVVFDTAPANVEVPSRIDVRVMEKHEIEARQAPVLRFPRQIQHFGALVDYILNTQDKLHLRRAVQVYFNRLQQSLEAFQQSDSDASSIDEDESS